MTVWFMKPFALALLSALVATPAYAAWPFDGITGTTDATKKDAPAAVAPSAPPAAVTLPKQPTAPTKPVVAVPATPTAPAKQVTITAPAKTVAAPAAAAAVTLPAKPAVVETKKEAAPVAKEPVKAAEPAKVEPAKVEAPKVEAAPAKVEAPKADPAAEKAAAEKAAAEKASADKYAAEQAAKAKTDAENAKAAAEKQKAEAEAAKAAEEKQKAEAVRLEDLQKRKDAATIGGHLEAKGNFKILLELFDAAKIKTLKSPGNYTLFAPTDAAFSKFTGMKMDDLKNPAYIDQLKNLLGFHMLNGNFLMKNVQGTKAAPNALQGDILDIDATTETVRVNKAAITETDTGATNGTIYVLDAVMLPPNLLAQFNAAKEEKAKEIQ